MGLLIVIGLGCAVYGVVVGHGVLRLVSLVSAVILLVALIGRLRK